MKMLKNLSRTLFASCTAAMLLSSCGGNGDSTGYEYMPNMYRSPSVETYGGNALFSDSSAARTPVAGTIPRGFKPFEYGSSLEEFVRAGEELVNPLEQNAANLEDGKELYQMFCAHCHGKTGDGKGTIKNPIYGGIPSYADNVMSRRVGTMSELTDGHIYHTITYGLNAMGPHASQLMPEERWKIVQYVHELQQGKK
jgi:mono/diheme cytochrome c family protein